MLTILVVAAVAAIFALGFGAGRVKHPANLKLSAVKAEAGKIEGEAVTKEAAVKAEILAVVARIKSLV